MSALRILIGLFLVALSAFAQSPMLPGSGALWFKPAAASGGGGGCGIGIRPAVQSTRTNGDSSATATISVSMPAATAQCPMDFIYVDFYSAAQTISSVTDNGSACTLITNGLWYADANGKEALYVFTNPPNSSRTITVTWTGNPDEKTLSVACVTNVPSAWLRAVAVDHSVSAAALTFALASSSTDFVLGGASAAVVNPTWTLSAGSVLITQTNAGASTHDAIMWSTNASASSIAPTVGSSENNKGGIAVSIKAP